MVADAILSLSDVGVCFRRKRGLFKISKNWALNKVSFTVLHGETLGIIGGNGAGKSTVLRVIAGIIQPDCGTVIKEEAYTASILALQLGFLPYLSARENIYLSGMLMGMSKSELNAAFQTVMDFCELGDYVNEPVRTFSVGMKARLGFAIAYQANPDILLIDEVLGVGDAAFKRKSATAMKQKIQSNKTVVLVSHNPQTILELCDRVVWIERGEVVDIGAADVLVENYEKKMASR